MMLLFCLSFHLQWSVVISLSLFAPHVTFFCGLQIQTPALELMMPQGNWEVSAKPVNDYVFFFFLFLQDVSLHT